MQVYNPATKQTAEVTPKSFGLWAQRGWVLVDQVTDMKTGGDEPPAEVTAEASGRRAHPSAKGPKDK